MLGLMLKELWEGILEAAFPGNDICPLCKQRPFNGGFLCPICYKELTMIDADFRRCPRCGKWGHFEKGQSCDDCLKWERKFTIARAVAPYHGLLKEAIYTFKYTGQRTLAVPLGKMMAAEVLREKGFAEVDLIVPVPLHPLKLRERGFNQSSLLAKEISRILKAPCLPDVLRRNRTTVAQSKLTKSERRRNLTGAFSLNDARKVKEKNILLVDDIFTTGQTVSVCSQVLLDGGAKSVSVITLATGLVT